MKSQWNYQTELMWFKNFGNIFKAKTPQYQKFWKCVYLFHIICVFNGYLKIASASSAQKETFNIKFFLVISVQFFV